MDVWVKCRQCGKQTKSSGSSFSTSTCACGGDLFDVEMGSEVPDWWSGDDEKEVKP